MQIIVRYDQSQVYEVTPDLEVSHLHHLIEEKIGVKAADQRLVCRGKALCERQKTLAEYGLVSDVGYEETVYLTCRVLGGVKNPSKIANKIKREAVYKQYKELKKAEKKKQRLEKEKEVEALGDAAPPKQVPRTFENTRTIDETVVKGDDDEVVNDENDDEFSAYFKNEKQPKIMVTTRPKCSRKLFPFIGDLMQMIPKAYYYPRKEQTITEMAAEAYGKGYSHLICLGEKNKICNGLMVAHLPAGPTAYFKLSSFEAGADIKGHGKPTTHIPELIFNNFGTRLGRRIGRVLGSLFPHTPQLEGRQVVTFHNQRDFIFCRHHRYIYRKEKDKTRARLQELGPRFTLKPKWLQEGVFDLDHGEYEWVMKRGVMEADKKKFQM
jgi:ribosome production factor 1